MTDTTPTPTRAEVERDLLMAVLLGAEYRVDLDWLHKHGMEGATALGKRAAELTIAMRDERNAMRERAEAAERAVAAAWNDAIEAAGNLESIHGYSNAVPRHRIRALRRAAPTEDRCAECDCQNGGTECTWIKSGPVAAPTEGEA